MSIKDDIFLSILKNADYSRLTVNDKFLLWDNNSWRVFQRGLSKNTLIEETEDIFKAISKLLEE